MGCAVLVIDRKKWVCSVSPWFVLKQSKVHYLLTRIAHSCVLWLAHACWPTLILIFCPSLIVHDGAVFLFPKYISSIEERDLIIIRLVNWTWTCSIKTKKKRLDDLSRLALFSIPHNKCYLHILRLLIMHAYTHTLYPQWREFMNLHFVCFTFDWFAYMK